MSRVFIFDTTLRDGEQSPGASMNPQEKIRIAHALAELGVDVIEAGFPAASPDDFAAVEAIAHEVGRRDDGPTICGLARATEEDIERCARAIAPARSARIHTFLATSPIHRERKLGMTKAQVLERTRRMVALAVARGGEVEFSAEDAGRTEPEFLHLVVAAAIEEGARIVNIPDTVGYTQPDEFGALIAGILRAVPAARDIVLSVHCHDDLGLAVANTLAGLRAGARQAEVSVNGIGERAGNASLEEVVMALETRRDFHRLDHGVQTRRLFAVSRLVSETTGMEVQPNKAIVGKNAFAHEAGIHQDGMIKSRDTYEIMQAEMVGAPRTDLVMGKHSGRRALKARLEELGVLIDGEALDHAFERFKRLADRRKQVTDSDLVALVRDEAEQAREIFKLGGIQVTSRVDETSTAHIQLTGPTRRHELTGTGAGPVEAVFNAIDGILGSGCSLRQFRLRATNEGSDALGEALVQVSSPDGRSYRGFGSDQDVVIASARAYLAALNKALASREGERTVGEAS